MTTAQREPKVGDSVGGCDGNIPPDELYEIPLIHQHAAMLRDGVGINDSLMFSNSTNCNCKTRLLKMNKDGWEYGYCSNCIRTYLMWKPN